MQVYFSVLLDKSVQEYAVMACLDVASYSGSRGYGHITYNCQRTDVARNRLAKAFRHLSKDPNDVLIMLDCDHVHPIDIVERLANHPPELGVVGALAFSRGAPHFPCFFMRNTKTGNTMNPLEFTGGVMKGVIVGTGAIAIRRWVFDKIADAGYKAPFFYEYRDEMFETGNFQSEDVTFGLICEKLGIPHYCDTGLITPHLTATAIDETLWLQQADYYKQQHADQVEMIKE